MTGGQLYLTNEGFFMSIYSNPPTELIRADKGGSIPIWLNGEDKSTTVGMAATASIPVPVGI
ncbi:unnamed protein product [marine sediment metagenome]|uniref:Uncharacterized protein n=1 Tax=marine sediment metagenome TaxID=412755 RepID=X1I926_9ZZZZ